jgi:hypothetical protein
MFPKATELHWCGGLACRAYVECLFQRKFSSLPSAPAFADWAADILISLLPIPCRQCQTASVRHVSGTAQTQYI